MFSSKDLFFTPTSGAYTVSKSLRFRSSASASLSRTPASAGNQQKWTWSGWIKRGSLGSTQSFFGNFFAANNNSQFYVMFDANNCLSVGLYTAVILTTTAIYRDPSAWYHVVILFDSTQTTASNRLRLFVNGSEILSFSTDSRSTITLSGNYSINAAQATYIGYNNVAGYYFDGYLAEVNFVDGSPLTSSSFGAYDTNGIWQPAAYTGSYGNNGFYLKFTDVGATSGSNTGYGKDFAGTNYWTTNNFGTTSNLTTYDSMLDSPTNATGDIGNYAVVNPIAHPTTFIAPTDGNLSQNCNTSAWTLCVATLQIPNGSGLWQWELVQTGTANGANAFGVALSTVQANVTGDPGSRAGCSGVNNSSGAFINGATSGSITYPTVGNTVTCLYDATNLTFQVFSNGTSQGTITGLPAGDVQPFVAASSSNGSPTFVLNFGQRPFAYDKGGKALNTQNLTTPTITNGAQYMAATTYIGAGSTQAITNGGNNNAGTTFQPDFVWIKNRGAAWNNNLYDVIRGTGKALFSDLTDAEATNSIYGYLSAFSASGFSATAGTTSGNLTNQSSSTYVAWQWKAGGTGVTNTSGSITSTVSANTSAGFSITQFTASGSNATIGHGLGVAPSMVIVKDAASAGNWAVWHSGLTSGSYYLFMNTTAAQANTSAIFTAAPTSTVVSIGTWHTADRQIMYCFAPVAGYSAFGSYTGNGSADGVFVYTGMRPRYLFMKRTDSAGTSWWQVDSSCNPYNVTSGGLTLNTSDAESSGNTWCDFLSNGFKIRTSSVGVNASGGTYIYAAFAENPFKISRAR
jgi:hypothetical protein